MPNLSRLPKPVFESYEWQERGACRQVNPDRFFTPDGLPAGERRAHEAAAKALCARCPVIRECLDHALEAHEPFGVWGGLSASERAQLLRTAAS